MGRILGNTQNYRESLFNSSFTKNLLKIASKFFCISINILKQERNNFVISIQNKLIHKWNTGRNTRYLQMNNKLYFFKFQVMKLC